MKSMKKTFALFVLFSMMVTCLSLSSFALEPDTVPSNTAPDADVAMSETDTVADAIEEDAVIMPEHEAMLDDVVSEGASEVEIVDPVDSADTYPACDHNYVTSPVGSPREVYDPTMKMYAHEQDYIHRCTKYGEYYYTTEISYHS